MQMLFLSFFDGQKLRSLARKNKMVFSLRVMVKDTNFLSAAIVRFGSVFVFF